MLLLTDEPAETQDGIAWGQLFLTQCLNGA